VNTVRSEWTKLRSLRSTWLVGAVVLLLGLGVGALASSALGNAYATATAEERADWDPMAAGLPSLLLTQLAVGVLGVLVITGEYATGTIQPSVVAVPKRGRLYAAKAAVLGGLALALGQLVGFASFFIGQALIANSGAPHAVLDQPGVLRAVIGAGLYLTAIALLGFGLGAIVRSTAGGIGLVVGVTLLVRLIAQALPTGMSDWMDRYWPTAAGEKIIAVVPQAGTLGPWGGFGLLCAFVAVVCGAGYVLLRTRDT
jgi:ABC-type transport system involved in multi-copper enzyme maturation permease subunit